jgi:hypothetical protein
MWRCAAAPIAVSNARDHDCAVPGTSLEGRAGTADGRHRGSRRRGGSRTTAGAAASSDVAARAQADHRRPHDESCRARRARRGALPRGGGQAHARAGRLRPRTHRWCSVVRAVADSTSRPTVSRSPRRFPWRARSEARAFQAIVFGSRAVATAIASHARARTLALARSRSRCAERSPPRRESGFHHRAVPDQHT